MFWSITNSGDVLNKLKSKDFRAANLSNYDFSTLCKTLPHNLIKEKMIDLIERPFKGKDLCTLHVMIEMLSLRLKSIKVHYVIARGCV